MASENTKSKSSHLGLFKIAESVTVLKIAEAFKAYASHISGITISTKKSGLRTAEIMFNSIEGCESAKLMEKVTIDGNSYEIFYANNRKNTSSLSASLNKVYVKYPTTVDFDKVTKILGSDIEIKKPEAAKNYFFATCKDFDQQCELVKKFNNMKIDGGVLQVKIAIDKVVPPKKISNKITSN